ncbi:MAG: hypothetical protein WB622_16635, partial [Acidobacteriaceae bacterium]
ALGYDLNTVEFAVEDGVPYAIDFMNPAPDADLHSVGQANFDWIVNAVADLAIHKAQTAKPHMPEFHWSAYLGVASQKPEPEQKSPAKKAAPAKTSAKKTDPAQPAAKKNPAKKAAKSPGKSGVGQPESTVSAIE